MDAQIGKNVNKFSLRNSSNRNGEHLTDFILDTKFQKRKEKLWTYTYANNTKVQICNNSALDCEAHSSFEGVSSDHRILTAKYDWAYEGIGSNNNRTQCLVPD